MQLLNVHMESNFPSRNHGSSSDLAISRTVTLESRPPAVDPPPYLQRERKYSPGERSLGLLNRVGEAIERLATRGRTMTLQQS